MSTEEKENKKALFYVHAYDVNSNKAKLALQYRISTDQISRIINEDLFVADEILGNKVTIENSALKWYYEKEFTARQKYSGELEKDAKRTQPGICIHSSYPWLAAKIGDLVNEDTVANFWCPYSQKMPSETPSDYLLKTQGDLEVSKRDIGNVVIWTPYNTKIAVVKRDKKEWKEFTFPILKRFYKKKILPVMINRGIKPEEYYKIDLKDYTNIN